MFGSNILDIAIGMIFVYLLLSLICSAANEIIEAWLKNRATDLERGIRELLDPNAKVEAGSIVNQIYDHPLVNGLYKGFYKDFVKYHSGFRLLRWLKRISTTEPKLPSYIPARNFALALMDTVLPGTTAVPSGTAGATPPPPAAPAAPTVVVNTATPAPTTPTTTPNPLLSLRSAVSAIPNVQTRNALLALVDAAGNDVSKARENIENWFNSSMDRVSGWYKERSQYIIFVLGFGVAVALNADSVTLVKRLSTDKTLRDSLVAAAEAYAKATPSPTPATGAASDAGAATSKTSAPGAKPSPTASPKASPTTSPTAAPTPSPTTSPTASPTTSPTTSPTAAASASPATSPAKGTQAGQQPAASPAPTPLPPPDECVKDKDSPECKLALNRREIEKLGLPIGWVTPDDKEYSTLPDDRRKWPGNHWKRAGGWWDQLYWHFPGWLITALAVSLGAPFWFDLLNKFIVVRSTVKPHEKSPEEGSKA